MSSLGYLRAKELKSNCKKDATKMIKILEEFNKNCSELYGLLRWTSLNCSDEEYEELYSDFVGFYEDNRMEENLYTVLQFLKGLRA